ncbi:MAG: hypothetical protein WBA54_06110 [Acidaminobacteraceae bacterium]
MPIRPMDMQVILPKVQSNSKAKEIIIKKEVNELQQSQFRNKEDANVKHKKVPKNEQKTAEDNKIKKELDKNNKKNKKRKKNVAKEIDKENNTDKDEKKETKSLSYHKFDMKV